jgi:hypothetical protein
MSQRAARIIIEGVEQLTNKATSAQIESARQELLLIAQEVARADTGNVRVHSEFAFISCSCGKVHKVKNPGRNATLECETTQKRLTYQWRIGKNHNLRGVEGNHVLSGKTISIGRHPDSVLQLPSTWVSRHHCALNKTDSGYEIRDLGSSNGTYVNEIRLPQNVPVPLRAGDLIRLAGIYYRYIGPNVINGYEIQSMVASGALGRVFKGWDARESRKVAIKISPLVADDEKIRRRLEQGFRLHASLSHKHILQVLWFGVDAGETVIVMEYVDGGMDLEKHIQSFDGNARFKEAVRTMRQILRGMQHYAEAKIVHRDIKPGNILVDRSGNCKISGFSICYQQPEDPLIAPTVSLGTPGYMSPEAFKTNRVDIKSDLYALGATYFRVLTGKSFNKGDNLQDIARNLAGVEDQRAKIKQLLPDCPEGLVEVLRKLTDKESANRYKSPEEVITALNEIEFR